MRSKTLLIIAGVSAAVSCEIVDYQPHTSEGVTEPEQRGDLYYSTVEYDTGYDWRKDSLGGIVDCFLTLYREHQPIARVFIPSSEYQSTYCEMHNIYDGSLYSVHYIGDKTIIRQNGVNLVEFGYDGPIESFIVHEGVVHSISITPGDKGWRYRKNAEMISESPSGHIMGNLYIDRDQVCFAFAEKLVSSGMASAYRYHFVADGNDQLLSLMPSVTEVLAVMRVDGTLNILEREANISWPVWIREGASMITSVDRSLGMRDYWFCVMGDEVYAHAQARIEDKNMVGWNDCFWSWGSLEYKTLAKKQVVAICTDRHQMCYVTSDNAVSGELQVIHAGETYDLDESLIMPSPYALCCSRNGFVIGLNDSSEKNRPVVIDGADTIKKEFNGYFTHFRLP